MFLITRKLKVLYFSCGHDEQNATYLPAFILSDATCSTWVSWVHVPTKSRLNVFSFCTDNCFLPRLSFNPNLLLYNWIIHYLDIIKCDVDGVTYVRNSRTHAPSGLFMCLVPSLDLIIVLSIRTPSSPLIIFVPLFRKNHVSALEFRAKEGDVSIVTLRDTSRMCIICMTSLSIISLY